MRVLITGATGFLGSHLCRRMVVEGHDVRILARSSSDNTTLEGLSLDRVIGDITDPESVRTAVQDREWVIHAAADLNDRRWNQSWQIKVNVEGTRNIAQACRAEGVRRLLHVSSVAAIGIPTSPQHPANEEFPFNLEHTGLTYHLTKRQAEKEVMTEVARGLDAIIVNPADVKGPHGTQYRGAEIVRAVRRAPVVPYFSGGICVVHVQDVVEGILAALLQGATGQRYILGGENLTFRALAERAAKTMGLGRRFIPVPRMVTGPAAMILEPWGLLWNHRPWIRYTIASRFQFYDFSKACMALGYAPRDFSAILDECLRMGRVGPTPVRSV